jgi:biotin/methionine sulfoxide reductase
MKEHKSVRTATHWGVFDVQVTDGRITQVAPYPGDPDPSPIGQNLLDAVTDKSRITQPMVREGWLRDGPRYDGEGRGKEAFVPVSWDRALDLVASEISRVKTEFGNEAIFGGSYGWASSGRFHHSLSQLHRFLKTVGGYTASANSYSTGTARVIVPHVVGHAFFDVMEQ